MPRDGTVMARIGAVSAGAAYEEVQIPPFPVSAHLPAQIGTKADWDKREGGREFFPVSWPCLSPAGAGRALAGPVPGRPRDVLGYGTREPAPKGRRHSPLVALEGPRSVSFWF